MMAVAVVELEHHEGRKSRSRREACRNGQRGGHTLVVPWRLSGKLLRSAKPSAIPVEQPATLELIVNGRTAKALGLTVPPSILASAAEVIE